MFRLKDIIFNNFFTNTEKREDTNKDGNDKGTLERYSEMLAEDWDDNLIPLVSKFIENTLIPDTVIEKFIPYLEAHLGLKPISNDLVQRRRLLRNIITVYKTKGTLRSYQIVMRSLGFENVNIIPVDLNYGFDSEVEFDSNQRRFDQGGNCHKCRYYTLDLIGDLEMTSETLNSVLEGVKLIEPIYANLYRVFQNGEEIDIISIFVDNNGDLIYDFSIEASLDLNRNGDLYIEGSQAGRFSITANGDIIYT